MGIKTSAKENQSLFISTDADSWGRVIFTFHKNNATEAINIIPLLPIYLAHQYGPRAWSWFNQEAKNDLTEYYYDIDTGEIKCNEDQYVQDIVDEKRWEDNPEQSTNQIQIDFSLSEWVVDVENIAKGNQFNDNGTVKTANQSSDGNTTATTINSDNTTGGISTLTGESERDQ